MGKHGPCYHCGVTSTPLWRNGPPEKPVLCNACGSRWRTKGTLENYTPLHARAEADPVEDYRGSKVKTLPINNKEVKVLKRKNDYTVTDFGGVPLDFNQGFRKGFDEDTSNRSSSGSAISNTESCAKYGSADASDLTGPSQPVVWDSMVPSRKRTCVTRAKPSPVEKLTKDLYTIWHEQQSSCLSACSEEDLLLESDKPMVSVEIGHGSVLIRHPNSIDRDEESEASSLSIDNKRHTFSSQLVAFPALIEDTRTAGVDKFPKPVYVGTEKEKSRRDIDQPEKLQILAHHNSPLCHIDLQEIVNLNKFLSYLTNDEQQQLLKLLPPIDTLEGPDRNSYTTASLRSMFESPQFKENLLSFQKILADGIFDNSLSDLKTEDCRVLRKLVLCNLTKSTWVEQYKIFKDSKGKSVIDESVAVKSNALATDSSLSVTKPREAVHQKFSGAKAIMKSPKKIVMRSSYNEDEIKIDEGCPFFSPKNLFCSDYGDESYEQDLLFDVPSNSSFPQAELLSSSSFGAQASITSSTSVYPYVVHP